jgi:hypothetical protein
MKLKEVSEMVKKTLLVLVLAACAAGMAFALPEFKLSAGAGIIGANTWQVVTESWKNEQTASNDFVGKPNPGDIKYTKKTGTHAGYDFGGFLFFDATYAEFDVTIGGGKVEIYSPNGTGQYDATKLGLALYGKYPFAVGDSGVTIAPLVGAQFDMVLAAKDDFGNAVEKGDKDKDTGVLLYDGKDGTAAKYKNGTVFDYSTIAVKLGAEAKAPLSEKLYLSTQALWGITFNSAAVESWRKAYADFYDSSSTPKLDIFTHGVTFKLSVGYTF